MALLDAIGQLADQPWTENPDAASAATLANARGTVLESGLLPYYDAVAPEFWTWAGGSSSSSP